MRFWGHDVEQIAVTEVIFPEGNSNDKHGADLERVDGSDNNVNAEVELQHVEE